MERKKMNDSLIVIPTYNAKAGISKTITKIQREVPQTKILFVDDSSPDGTAKFISSRYSKDKRIHVLIRKRKDGRGSAVLYGLREGLKDKKINYFIEMDADLCHDPKYIKKLIAKAKNSDVVIASRYLPESRIYGWNLKRKLMSFSINTLAKFLLQIPISDYTDGFRCYSRKAVEIIDSYKIQSRGYIVLSEVAYICYKKGLRFSEVPIDFYFETITKSNLNWREVKEALLTLIRLRLTKI